MHNEEGVLENLTLTGDIEGKRDRGMPRAINLTGFVSMDDGTTGGSLNKGRKILDPYEIGCCGESCSPIS